MAKQFLFTVTREAGLGNLVSMTVLRIFVGLSMAIAHGMGKIPPSEGFISGVAALGFPAPEGFAWLAAGAEFAGGLLLAVGFLTRPAALLVAVTMAVAAFGAHGADPYRVKELAFMFLFVSLAFAFRGASQWSVDRFFTK